MDILYTLSLGEVCMQPAGKVKWDGPCLHAEILHAEFSDLIGLL